MKKILLLCCLLCCGCTRIQPTSASLDTEIPSYIQNLSSKNISWGIGKEVDAAGQPLDCIKAQELYGKYNATFIQKAEPMLYLTFDAGYESGHTATLLDILKKHNARAVFFVTGNYVVENKELILRMISEGHILGNHSYKHKIFTTNSLETIKKDVLQLEELLRSEFDYETFLVRPPEGRFNEQTLALMKELGYETMLWSFAYYDYVEDHQINHDEALAKCKEHLHPGAIFLLHTNSSTNAAILDELITYAKEQGYQIGNYIDQKLL